MPWLALAGAHRAALSQGQDPGARRSALPRCCAFTGCSSWFGFSGPVMEEALHDAPAVSQVRAHRSGLVLRLGESTILRFRHLLEAHKLAARCSWSSMTFCASAA